MEITLREIKEDTETKGERQTETKTERERECVSVHMSIIFHNLKSASRKSTFPIVGTALHAERETERDRERQRER